MHILDRKRKQRCFC